MTVNRYRRSFGGLEDLRGALADLGTEVATKVGVSANRRAARLLADRLKAAAPRSAKQSPASKTYGRLSANIRVRRVKGRVVTRIKHQIGTGDAFWGQFLELGTARQPARPWMRPEIEAAMAEIAGAHVDELRRGIDRAVRRLAKRSRR